MSLQDNTLDFLEYVAALHLILRGNLEDRLRWSFKMYDKDGNGKLDRQEVKRIIRVGLTLFGYFCEERRASLSKMKSGICQK